MLESLFNTFADLKSQILLNERLHHGYFSMKKFYLRNTFLTAEAVVRRCSIKNLFLEISQNLQENIKKDSLAQVFSCKFCEISKYTFFIELLQTTASAVNPTRVGGVDSTPHLHFFT